MNALNLDDRDVFYEILYEKMKGINPGIAELELYEFRYCLDNLTPEGGWEAVELDTAVDIEQRLLHSYPD
jgi:hypothetical protein